MECAVCQEARIIILSQTKMCNWNTLNYIPAYTAENWLLLHLRPNYIHSASNDIHTDGPRARARARASG